MFNLKFKDTAGLDLKTKSTYRKSAIINASRTV
jgi:hypothetical protein